MRNFKEFLKEEVESNYPSTTTYINFSLSKSKYANGKKDLFVGEEIGIKEYGPYFEGFDIVGFNYCNDNKFEIKTDIKKEGIVDTQEHFMDYKIEMTTAVGKMIELDSIRIPFPEASYVFSSAFPKLFVGTKCLAMTCSKLSSLTGVNKIINCEKLKLGFAHNIKGNILSLMIMSNLKKIEAPTAKGWVDIINKHLTGDRDLLDCKEELMNVELKEYAKL